MAEFGLVAPILLMLLLGLIEGGWQMLTAVALDFGARQASRFGALGTASPDWLPGPAPASREAALRQIVLYYGQGVLDPARLTVSLAAYADAGALRTGTGAVTGSAGGAAAMVTYQFDYTQPAFILAPLSRSLWGRSFFVHRAHTVVRNEPF
nr:TadE/TadG family type IV pilus assembly protein [Roseomonas acroporae]